jgi:hypothetical protein
VENVPKMYNVNTAQIRTSTSSFAIYLHFDDDMRIYIYIYIYVCVCVCVCPLHEQLIAYDMFFIFFLIIL